MSILTVLSAADITNTWANKVFTPTQNFTHQKRKDYSSAKRFSLTHMKTTQKC